MNEVYIAFGSNLGERENNIRAAIGILASKIEGIRLSRIHETVAEGMEPGHFHPFMNAVAYGKTNLDARSLMSFLLETESVIGRTRSSEKGYHSRIIDLDLLIFNQDVLSENNLELPHPRLHERLFVLKPLMDLNPELIVPGRNRKVCDLYDDLMMINS